MAWGLCGVGIGKPERAGGAWRAGQRPGWTLASRAPARVDWRDTPQVRPCRLVRAIHGALRSRRPTRTGTWMQTSQSLRSSKAALRASSQAGSLPHSTPTPHHHPPNKTPDQHLSSDTTRRKQAKAEPAVDLRCAPTFYGGAGMGGFAGPSSAWMRWRSLHGRTCSVPRGPAHASALPDAGTPNLILLWLKPLLRPCLEKKHPPHNEKSDPVSGIAFSSTASALQIFCGSGGRI
ncbi:hypothetical protein ABIA71_001961 [Stenotrophomonas sp. 2619]